MAKLLSIDRFRYVRWDTLNAATHNAGMALGKHRLYLRQWRKHRGLTLEALSAELGMSVGYLSDLEKGKRRYNQDHLEALAGALSCTPADLIIRDPADPDGIWAIWDALNDVERVRLVEIGKTLKRTGTDG